MGKYLNEQIHNEPYVYQDGFVLIPLSTFPSTMKKSIFYKNIYENHKCNDPKIPIPINIYKNQMNLSLLLDMLSSLMEIIELLPDKKMPYSNYDFIINNKDSIIPHLNKMRENYKTFDFMDEIDILINTPENEILKNLIISGRKHLLGYCLKKNRFNITPQTVFNMATEYYKIDILEYIFRNYKKEYKFYSESDSDDI